MGENNGCKTSPSLKPCGLFPIQPLTAVSFLTSHQNIQNNKSEVYKAISNQWDEPCFALTG